MISRRHAHALLDSLGFGSVMQLAKANPTATTRQLAELLGPSVAPIQVTYWLKRESLDTDQYLWFVRDALVRCVWRFFADTGWDGTPEGARVRRQLFAVWATAVKHRGATMEAFDRLEARVPHGWLPVSVDDELIIASTTLLDFRGQQDSKRAGESLARDTSATWDQAMRESTCEPVPYSAHLKLRVNQVVRHPLLGVGIVTAVPSENLAVALFRDGEHRMVHGKD